MQYDIDGVLIAHDGDREINAAVRLNGAAVSIRAFGSGRIITIHARKPSAIALVDALAAELLGIAIPVRPRAPEMVMCPDCFGGEPEVWDCETCKGGGRVPG